MGRTLPNTDLKSRFYGTCHEWVDGSWDAHLASPASITRYMHAKHEPILKCKFHFNVNARAAKHLKNHFRRDYAESFNRSEQNVSKVRIREIEESYLQTGCPAV